MGTGDLPGKFSEVQKGEGERLSLGKSNTCYVLKQWMALKARSDWLLHLQLSFAIHLRSTRAEFAP